jgi:hypothetical protein
MRGAYAGIAGLNLVLHIGVDAVNVSDVVLEAKVLVSRLLEDKNQSLGLVHLGLGLGSQVLVLVLS